MSSAVMTTESMLAEIGCGTAAEVVLEARNQNHPFGLTFIDKLDSALATARPASSNSSIDRGDMIEITGSSGSGKTTLLTFLLVGSLLPAQAEIHYPNPVTLPLGGRGQYAALIHPISHRSLLPRVEAGLRVYINNAIHTTLGDIEYRPELTRQIDDMVQQAMGRLKVIRPRARNKAWALALKSLLVPDLRKVKEGEGLDLVVCDGFGDGFYHERHADERRRAVSGTAGSGKRVPGLRGGEDVGLGDVVRAINELRSQMGAVVVLSIQGLWNNGSFFATHLPSPYPAPFTPGFEDRPSPAHAKLNVQIALHGPLRPLQLPPDLTLVEAMYKQSGTHDRPTRTHEGSVRVIGAEGDVGSRTGVKFTYEVGPTGIEAWHE